MCTFQIKHIGQGDENGTSQAAKNIKILLELEHQGVCQEMGLYSDLFEQQGQKTILTICTCLFLDVMVRS